MAQNNSDFLRLNDVTGEVSMSKNLTITGNISVGGTVAAKAPVINVTTATAAPTAAQTGSLITLNKADGITVTLPAPSVGLYYDFVVGTTASGGSYKVITNAGTTFITGALMTGVGTTASKTWLGNAAASLSINLNGTTTGGIIGSSFRLFCTSATIWTVSGILSASGTEATPFANS